MRILVGFPPGGSADIVARLMTESMKAALDQNVIVDNRPGAAGRVALGEVKRAAPDGNTVVLAPSGALVILPWLYKNVGYDPMRDFTPIARVAPSTLPSASALVRLRRSEGAARVAESESGQGQLRDVRRRHGAALRRRAAVAGDRRSADPRGVQGRRSGGSGPARRPGAGDDRHALGNDRALSRRQAAHPRRHRRKPLGRVARGADAEGARDQRRRRRVLRPIRAGEHAQPIGSRRSATLSPGRSPMPRCRRASAPSR